MTNYEPKIETIYGDGHSTLPVGRGHSLPTPYSPWQLRSLKTCTFGTRPPPSQNPKYATVPNFNIIVMQSCKILNYRCNCSRIAKR